MKTATIATFAALALVSALFCPWNSQGCWTALLCGIFLMLTLFSVGQFSEERGQA